MGNYPGDFPYDRYQDEESRKQVMTDEIDRRIYSFGVPGSGIVLEWYRAEYVEELREQVRVLRGACIEAERRMGDPYLDPSYWEVCPERGLLNAAIAGTEPVG